MAKEEKLGCQRKVRKKNFFETNLERSTLILRYIKKRRGPVISVHVPVENAIIQSTSVLLEEKLREGVKIIISKTSTSPHFNTGRSLIQTQRVSDEQQVSSSSYREALDWNRGELWNGGQARHVDGIFICFIRACGRLSV